MSTKVLSDPRSATHDKVISPQEYYDGEMNESREMHGEGTYAWGDRTNWHGKPAIIYSGKWKSGLMHGFGLEIDEEGTYVGPFKADHRHGRLASHLHADGTIYVGQMAEDEPDAVNGLTIDPDGKVHRGTKVISSPTMDHKLDFGGGSYYDGMLNDAGQEHGDGVQVWGGVTNWKGGPFGMYAGLWKEGRMHGFGVHIGAHGTYVGFFEEGRRCGEGVYFYRSGSVYAGRFADDQAADKGKIVDPDGTVTATGA